MWIYVFIIGLLIGSFLNVCIYRIPKKESIAFGASHCTKCGSKIKWYDLIPVFSYIFLRGKCRKCKDKISIQYPLIELLNAVLYTVICLFTGFTINTLLLCILTSVLIVVIMIKLQSA